MSVLLSRAECPIHRAQVQQRKLYLISVYFCRIFPFNQTATLWISLSYAAADSFPTNPSHKKRTKGGFIQPAHCRTEKLGYSLRISKASRFFLGVSKTVFSNWKPCYSTRNITLKIMVLLQKCFISNCAISVLQNAQFSVIYSCIHPVFTY